MTRARALFSLASIVILQLAACARYAPASEFAAPYVPTPTSIVDEMLQLAKTGPDDYVIDLGSGDGRLVMTAVTKYQARGGFGVDIDRDLVKQANEGAAKAGIADRVQFYERDLFETDVKDASVVTIYLLPKVMPRLEKKLLAELKPGARVVVHDYGFPTWQPERVIETDALDKIKATGFTFARLYLYRVPARAAAK